MHQNCAAPVGDAFRGIFGFLWRRRVVTRQDKKGEKHRKGAPTGGRNPALVSSLFNTSDIEKLLEDVENEKPQNALLKSQKLCTFFSTRKIERYQGFLRLFNINFAYCYYY